jgi:hypothetical protein
MEHAPDLAPETLTASSVAFPAPAARHPSRMSFGARALLVSFVVVLGLLQGSRTALGSAPLPPAPATADVASLPAREADWRRGHFYRPTGSAAERPRPVLRPVVWRPGPAPARIAKRCAGRPDGSC